MQVSDDPRVGTELAGDRIESLLGWGGMSVVYLAEGGPRARPLHRIEVGARPVNPRIVKQFRY